MTDIATTAEPDPTVGPVVKPGYTTTEFYVALAAILVPVLNIIFKHDVTPLVQSFGEIGAGIGTVAYIISRTWLKHKTAVAK